MGNSKSRKLKINELNASDSKDKTEGRINAVRTDVDDAGPVVTIKDVQDESYLKPDDLKDDNASSASTAEILDDNNAAARSKSSKMPAETIKLYYVPPSPPCRAVMLAAKVIGVELELVLTNLMEGQHMTPEYLKMNPQHTVPTMDDNGFILWESRAIITYLANAYSRDDSLYPKNPRARALVDQRLNFDLGTLYNRYITLYGPVLFQGAEMDDEKVAKLKEAIEWLDKALEGRVFVAGDDMTVADISIVVTFTNLHTFGFDFSEYERVTQWFGRMTKLLKPHGYEEIDETGAKILLSFLKKD